MRGRDADSGSWLVRERVCQAFPSSDVVNAGLDACPWARPANCIPDVGNAGFDSENGSRRALTTLVRA